MEVDEFILTGTGVYRPPKKGEWCRNGPGHFHRAGYDYPAYSPFEVLSCVKRRVNIEDPAPQWILDAWDTYSGGALGGEYRTRFIEAVRKYSPNKPPQAQGM